MEGKKLFRTLCIGAAALGVSTAEAESARTRGVVRETPGLDLSPVCIRAEEGTGRVAALFVALCPPAEKGASPTTYEQDERCRQVFKLYQKRKEFENVACRRPRLA